MNKTIKILTVIALIIIMMTVFTNNVLAKSADIITQIENETNKADVSNATNKIMPKVGQIIRMIRNFSIIAGVIILIVLGVKYMIGSVEEKSGYQKAFVPLVIGIILVMAATSIASFLFGMME